MTHLGRQEQLVELEAQRANVMIERDFEALEQLSHPELRYIHSNGTIDTFESYLESWRVGRYVYHDINLPVDEIILAGKTAVILGRFQASVTVDGQEKILDYPSISVWTYDNGQWRFLSFSPRAEASNSN